MKTGIVFEGGALRTIYSCGVSDALLEAGLPLPDYTIGASAGAAYGVSYLSRQIGRNLEILTRFAGDKRYMGARQLLDRSNRSYFGIQFTYDEIPNKLVPFDYDSFAAYEGVMEAVMTDLSTGEPYYAIVPRRDSEFKILQATCAMPLLFPVYDIDGVPCLDGGVADGVPYERAFAQGCDKVVVVLTRERSYVRKAESLMPLMRRVYRKYPKFIELAAQRHVRYNRDRARLFELERKGKVLVFYPQSTEGYSRTERDVGKIRELYENGLTDGRNRIQEVKDFWNV